MESSKILHQLQRSQRTHQATHITYPLFPFMFSGNVHRNVNTSWWDSNKIVFEKQYWLPHKPEIRRERGEPNTPSPSDGESDILSYFFKKMFRKPVI